jgi:ribose-phosphate pyrophosphokinase
VIPGGTIAQSVDALMNAGARPDITVAATHGLLLPGARAKLGRSEIRQVVVTDTVAADNRAWPELHIVSVAPLLAGALQRLMDETTSVNPD